MHVKRIHEMIEKLTECAKAELDRGVEQVDVEEMGAVIDMIKDLCCAEKEAEIVKAMKESEEEEKKSDEYFLRMLKEEYGDDEGKRYYDNYRYANGRFAPKGRGTYRSRSGSSSRSSRRGFEEMPYYYMMEDYDPEWMRDMDRMSMNRLYYSGSGSSGSSAGGNAGGGAGSSSGGASGASGGGAGGASGGSSGGGGSMGYSESMRGYSDGESRGYNDGYSRGYSEGRSSGSRGRNESRSERARRNYTETKEAHKGNSPQEKQTNLKELENYFSELAEDMSDLVKNMSPEERNLAKSKVANLANKL